MNIYITKSNERRLKALAAKGDSMSGLINRLLEKHFHATNPLNKKTTLNQLDEPSVTPPEETA